MAQSGYTPILIYASGTTGNTPSAGNLTSSASGAELALNYFDGKLFYKDASGNVQVLASKATGTVGGSNTQVQYNNNGVLAGAANLTYTASALSLAQNLLFTDNTYDIGASGATRPRTIYVATSVGVAMAPTYTLDVAGAGGFGSLGGLASVSANSVGIRGSSATTAGSSAIHFGDNYNSSSRQWAIINGWQAQGALSIVASTAQNTNPISSGNEYLRILRGGEWYVNGATSYNSSLFNIRGTGNALAIRQDATLGANTNYNIYSANTSGALTFGVLAGGNTYFAGNLTIAGSGSPAAWSGANYIQMNAGAIYNSGDDLQLASNAYYDGTNYRYIDQYAYSSRYNLYNGAHTFYVTSSTQGVGNTITYSQAFLIDRNGNGTLGFGGAGSQSHFFYINSGATGGSAIIGQRGGSNSWFYGDTYAALGSGTGSIQYTYGSNPYYIYTNGVNRVVVTGSGQVGINNGSPSWTLDLIGGAGIRKGNSIADASSAGGFYTADGTYGINFLPRAGGGNYNSVVQSSDCVIFGGPQYNPIVLAVHDGVGFRLTQTSAVINGNTTINGSLSKSSGSFRIDHPLPELEATHQLVHSFVEAPQADLYYRGKVELIGGKATVNIDSAAGMTEGTFVVLCRETQCFTTNESDWTPVRGSVAGNILTIEAQDQSSTATISWLVVGERHDKHMMHTEWTDENGRVIVEPLKEEIK